MDFYDDEIEDDFEDDFDMSDFNGHLKGKRCDQCGCEEIYFDGEQYECSNCGMIWLDEDDIGDYIPDEYEIHDNIMKEVLKSEKRLFQNSQRAVHKRKEAVLERKVCIRYTKITQK